MVDQAGTTPLMALDAIVLDTETTSLDPGRARIVQIGAVRLRQGAVAEDAALDLLVDPGEPVPPAATAVHHITDAMLCGAPDFRSAHEQLARFAAGAPVIGHSIGFDLAVLRREQGRAGLAWRKPRSLCTRLLAELANARLPDYSLETVAAWLGVDITDRHTALGDARATAAVFVALVPHLRHCGIRTFAEAEQACRRLSDALDEQHKAGWVEPIASPAELDAEATLARIDSYPYRHRTRDVMSHPPRLASAGITLMEATRQMMKAGVSSLFLADRPQLDDGVGPDCADVGIITERDILRAVAAHGAQGLERAVRDHMSRPLIAVPQEAYLYRAMGRMSAHGIRHLAVINDDSRLVGALSARDLLRLRASEAITLGDEIDAARDVPALAAAWSRLPLVARSLLGEGVNALDVAGVISRELGALTRRAGVLAERRMAEAGQGGPPVPYVLAILGSGGRGESLLAADQDNAIVFAEGEPDGPEDRWFAGYGEHLAEILNAVGVPLCKGGVMARNPEWRGSLSTWLSRVGRWVRHSRPQDLLNVDIFFDLRAVHGDARLARELILAAFRMGHEAPDFSKLLARQLEDFHPPLTLFGRLKTSNGRVDLKLGGLFPIVAGARTLAIRHNLVRRSTQERLDALIAAGLGSRSDLEQMQATQELLLGCILKQQLDDVRHGRPPGNAVDVRSLARMQRDQLSKALAGLSEVEETVRALMFRQN